MLLEQRWSKSEDEESTLPGKPLVSSPLSISKFSSYLSIILAASLERGTRARRVLVLEIADDEEVVVRVV